MTIALFLIALAQAAEPATAPVAPPESHVTVVRDDRSSVPNGLTNVAVLISCSSKPNFDYEKETAEFAASLKPLSSITTVVAFNNASAAEITGWFHDADALLQGNDPYRLLIVSISCPATGGDEDLETLGNGLAFAELVKAVRPIASSSLWLLDTSREGYGITADDIAHANLPDAFAISTGGPGKVAPGGLIGAAATVVKKNGAQVLSLDTLYFSGIKSMVPSLELYTSAGMSRDAWGNNGGRTILPAAAPLIVSIGDVKPPTPTRRPIPKGCWVAGAGALTMIGGSVLAGEAGGHYRKLEEYNNVGGETQEELTAEIKAYELDRGLAIAVGGVGALLTVGGLTWTVVDHNHHVKVTASPAGITGSF
jgi:hypothetical protein